MELLQCLIILTFSHVIGDGLLQSREMAKNKSKDLKVLFKHLFLLSIPIFITSLIFMKSPFHAVLFTICNGIFHGIIDWNLWNAYGAIVKKRITRNAYQQAKMGYGTIDSIPDIIKNDLHKFISDKKYADDPWFYHFIVTDQAFHALTFLILLLTGVFI